MSRLALAAALVAAAAWTDAAATCPAPRAGAAYTERVERALRSGNDILGRRLLAGEPTYARAAAQLRAAPLCARRPRHAPDRLGRLLPPVRPARRPARHERRHAPRRRRERADRPAGRRPERPRPHRRRALRRLPRAARDAAARGRVAADPADAVRPLPPGVVRRRAAGGLASYVHVEGPRVSVGPVAASGELYARWDGRRVHPDRRSGVRRRARRRSSPTGGPPRRGGAGRRARAARAGRRAGAARPEPRRSTWRYSVGNPYEEFSFPEGVDVAQVLAEWGFADVARAILARVADAAAERRTRTGSAARSCSRSARHARLSGDRSLLRAATPVLRGYVARARAAARAATGCSGGSATRRTSRTRSTGCTRRRSSGRGCARSRGVWARPGRPADARRARGARGAARARRCGARCAPRERRLARRLALPAGAAARRRAAVRVGDRRSAPGATGTSSRRTRSRPGSSRRGAARRGARSRYLRAARLAPARPRPRRRYALYGRDAPFPRLRAPTRSTASTRRASSPTRTRPTSSCSQPLRPARGRDDARTRSSRARRRASRRSAAQRYRAMYLPPNGAANAAFLETLRLLLVQETPAGLRARASRRRARGCGPGSGSSSPRCRRGSARSRYSLERRRGTVGRSTCRRGRRGYARLRLPAAAAASTRRTVRPLGPRRGHARRSTLCERVESPP